MNILGINYGGHDTSACILSNGKIIAACEEERYDKIKHSRNFPINAIKDCLKISNLKMSQIDLISFGFLPSLRIEDLYIKTLAENPNRINILIQDIHKIDNLENIENIIRKKTSFKKKIEFHNHHLCHLASSFYPSGFKKSLITSYDGIGEVHSALFAIGDKNKIKIIHDQNKFPNSLGLFYSAVTSYLGWRHHCDEGIIMGLAPFGNPHAKNKKTGKSYIKSFREIIKVDSKDPLKYLISLDWISYHKKRDTWVSNKFLDAFGPKRKYNQKLNNHHKNIAAALQLRLEEVIISQLKYLKKKYNIHHLCLSGGIALNCSLNGKISRLKIFEKIFVQPASGDAGVAIGSTIVSHLKRRKNIDVKLTNYYLGHKDSLKNILSNFNSKKINAINYGENIFKVTAKLLAKGKIVGWFQGRAEFGPRALGNRSILCKPFPVSMRDHINSKVKFRESFRPFAPSVLEEELHNYFDINQTSEHMLLACEAKNRKKKFISATVHVDNSCRVQSVSKKTNKKFWNLLNEFKKETEIPVLLNTSFNIKGMPIVNNSKDAIECFLKYKIDHLIIDNYLINKK